MDVQLCRRNKNITFICCVSAAADHPCSPRCTGKAAKIFDQEAGDAPVRERGNISISFTPRVFPTPQRESLSHEEEAVSHVSGESRE